MMPHNARPGSPTRKGMRDTETRTRRAARAQRSTLAGITRSERQAEADLADALFAARESFALTA